MNVQGYSWKSLAPPAVLCTSKSSNGLVKFLHCKQWGSALSPQNAWGKHPGVVTNSALVIPGLGEWRDAYPRNSCTSWPSMLAISRPMGSYPISKKKKKTNKRIKKKERKKKSRQTDITGQNRPSLLSMEVNMKLNSQWVPGQPGLQINCLKENRWPKIRNLWYEELGWLERS